jgi:hypothetical protein
VTNPRHGLRAVGLLALAVATMTAEPKERARRLEDVYIEGEIPVPQVLFVTGRDQRRFFDFQHRRYLEPSLEGSRDVAAAPTWVRVIGNRPVSGRKDAAR